MAEGSQSSPFARGAGNIALLHLLRPASLPRSLNSGSRLEDEDGSRRALSLQHEHCLASYFAFLAGLTGEPNHVIALAIEESLQPRAVNVVVAINKRKPGDGEAVLQEIACGFQPIFKALSRARLAPDSKQETFHAVISMSRYRILQRVGSGKQKASRTVRTKTLFANIVRTINDVLRRKDHEQRAAADRALLEMSSALEANLYALEKCNSCEHDLRLRDIVSRAYQLSRSINPQRFLHYASPKELDPNTREGFIRRLRKLGRYLEYSEHLYAIARKYDLFREAKTIFVSLDSVCFARGNVTLDDTSLDNCIARCGVSKSAFGKCCGKLGVNKVGVAGNFASKAIRVLQESKIHAEVQVLAHYELNPVELSPRVIRSNKDACYLCEALIRLHGRFLSPASHGVLYPEWRLPYMPAFYRLQGKLNLALEARISSEIRTLLSSPQQRVLRHPTENESAVSAPALNVSSTPTMSPSPSIADGKSQPLCLPADEGSVVHGEGADTSERVPTQAVPMHENTGAAADASSIRIDPLSPTEPGTRDPADSTPSRTDAAADGQATQPVAASADPQTASLAVGDGCGSLCYAVGGLTIYVNPPRGSGQRYEVSMQLLDGETARRLSGGGGVVFDVSRLPTGRDVDSGSRDSATISWNGNS